MERQPSKVEVVYLEAGVVAATSECQGPCGWQGWRPVAPGWGRPGLGRGSAGLGPGSLPASDPPPSSVGAAGLGGRAQWTGQAQLSLAHRQSFGKSEFGFLCSSLEAEAATSGSG